MFVRSWRLGLLACSVIPITALVNRQYSKWMYRNQAKVQDALAAANAVAQEVVGAVKTVNSFAKEEVELSRFESKAMAYYAICMKQVLCGLYGTQTHRKTQLTRADFVVPVSPLRPRFSSRVSTTCSATPF